MLPFLKNKEVTTPGVIIKTRAPDESKQEDSDDQAAAIESCAQELIRAIHAKDVKGASEALKDAFTILDSMPHEEGEHTNDSSPHTYDAQNQKAGAEAE